MYCGPCFGSGILLYLFDLAGFFDPAGISAGFGLCFIFSKQQAYSAAELAGIGDDHPNALGLIFDVQAKTAEAVQTGSANSTDNG